MTKRSILVPVFIIFITVGGFCYANGETDEQRSQRKIQEFVQLLSKGKIIEVETFFTFWDGYDGPLKPSEDKEEDRIYLVSRSPICQPLYKALKNYDFKKSNAWYREIGLTIKFYDAKYRPSVMTISLAKQGVILINGDAYEPTSSIMQALKYFMPYDVYEQISQSGSYYKYFIETKDKSKEVDSRKTDPNDVKK